MIVKEQFGRTGHASTRAIFGGYALSKATQTQANDVLDLLLDYGVNHIDVAPMYGSAEKRIGQWMEQHREDFFVATKSRKRTHEGVWEDLRRSLSRLSVDYVDLWQLHGLTNPAGWEKAMGSGGALEAFVEARDEGLVRFLGVTGHGDKVVAMHIRSLERFDFDAVMLPYSYSQMQNPRYAADFDELVGLCRERGVAVQTIKSVARRPWGNRPKTHNTYFYQPLESQDAIDTSVHWSLGLPNSFLVTAGDIQLLPKMLDATSRFEKPPSEMEMRAVVDKFGIQPIFSHPKRGKGRQTWGGKMSGVLEELIPEGFFRDPSRRTAEDVMEALHFRGVLTEGKDEKVSGALARRARKGVLRRSKVAKEWVYWTE